MWAQLAEKGFTTSPQHWFSDEDRVVVLTQVTVGGEPADQADVLTYRDGKLGQVPDGGRHRPIGARVRLQVALKQGWSRSSDPPSKGETVALPSRSASAGSSGSIKAPSDKGASQLGGRGDLEGRRNDFGVRTSRKRLKGLERSTFCMPSSSRSAGSMRFLPANGHVRALRSRLSL